MCGKDIWLGRRQHMSLVCTYHAVSLDSICCLFKQLFFSFVGGGCSLFKGDLQKEGGEEFMSVFFIFSPFCLRKNCFGLSFVLEISGL